MDLEKEREEKEERGIKGVFVPLEGLASLSKNILYDEEFGEGPIQGPIVHIVIYIVNDLIPRINDTGPMGDPNTKSQ